MKLGPNQLRWIESLESGRYPQGKNNLFVRDENGVVAYCCLGVACALWGTDGEENERLDRETQEILALRTITGSPAKGTSLAFLNDHGKSFSEIAALLRAKPENYFEKSA